MHPLNTLKLEGKARNVIDRYLALPFGSKPSCPYFNNRRRKSKSALRVLRGKGTPEEIAEEATIDALHARIDVSSLSTDTLKNFLVENGLGVDCSGFAYHVLNAFAEEKTGKSLKKFVTSNRKGFLGKLAARLRPAENFGVSSFAHERNSIEIEASEAKPGDIIVFLGTGKDGLYNHMVVITSVERLRDTSATSADTRITYAHSYAWPSDGTAGHGVREGDIIIHGKGDKNDLLQGTWKEKGVIGTGNYTYESAFNAKDISTRRLRFLS